jgi:hypothetical protein
MQTGNERSGNFTGGNGGNGEDPERTGGINSRIEAPREFGDGKWEGFRAIWMQ